MLSKYILRRLAQTPFLNPPPSKDRLAQEFIDALDIRRQSIKFSDDQEAKDWTSLASEAIYRAQSVPAKRYVWREFEKALRPEDEPHLFMAGYQWLQDNKEYCPPRNTSLLDWEEDTSFSCASLLCAASQLPTEAATHYISRWVAAQQQELVTSSNSRSMRPRQKMLLNKKDAFHNMMGMAHTNKVLWEYVLAPASGFLSPTIKNALEPPYIPLCFEYADLETLLSQVDSSVHTWVLSNTLCSGDFYWPKADLDRDTNTIKTLSRFTSTLATPQEKAFVVWDLIHRQANLYLSQEIVTTHFPQIKNLLDNLGLNQLESIRHAMLSEWHKPAQALITMDLPLDIHTDLAL